MSAFICSALHIKAIAIHATKRHEDGSYALINVKDEDFDLSDATTVARILIAENVKSVCCRYEDAEEESYANEMQMEVTIKDKYRIDLLAFSHVEMLKLIHCLNYQSCEHPHWRQSLGYRILKALERSLLRDLPGYDEAPWRIDDDYER